MTTLQWVAWVPLRHLLAGGPDRLRRAERGVRARARAQPPRRPPGRDRPAPPALHPPARRHRCSAQRARSSPPPAGAPLDGEPWLAGARPRPPRGRPRRSPTSAAQHPRARADRPLDRRRARQPRVRLDRHGPPARARLGGLRAPVRRHPRRPLRTRRTPSPSSSTPSSGAPTTRPPAAPTASSRWPACSARSRSPASRASRSTPPSSRSAARSPRAPRWPPPARSPSSPGPAAGSWAGSYRIWLDTLALTAVAHFTGLALEGAALSATLAAEALALAALARRSRRPLRRVGRRGFAAVSLLHTLGTLATPDALFVGLAAPARRRRWPRRGRRRAVRGQPRALASREPPDPRDRRRRDAALPGERRGRHRRRPDPHGPDAAQRPVGARGRRRADPRPADRRPRSCARARSSCSA